MIKRLYRAIARLLLPTRDPMAEFHKQVDSEPEWPEGVILRRGDMHIPVEVVYSGRRPDGTAVFTATGPRILPGDRMHIAKLPKMTTVLLHGPEKG